MFTVLVCLKGIRSTFNIFHHYFLIIKEKDIEIHPGYYHYGTHHRLGYTKRYIVSEVIFMCDICVDSLIESSYDLKHLWEFFPLINCETLTSGLIKKPVVLSLQIVTLSTIISFATWGILVFPTIKLLIVIVAFIISFLCVLVVNIMRYHLVLSNCTHLKCNSAGDYSISRDEFAVGLYS